LNGTDVANPCGLIAKSIFNDNYTLYDPTGAGIFINETGIANEFDRQYMYKRDANYTYTQWLDVEDEHFMVWMKTETFPYFKKMWGKINNDLTPGKYKFKIKNCKILFLKFLAFEVIANNATKSVVIAKAGVLGSTGFLGNIMMIASMYNILMLFLLFILLCKNRNKPFDESKMQW
jgi:hypothetical protein